MNSTKLHSLLRDACRRNGSQILWFATLESKERIKGRGKTRRGLSKAGAADRECNVERMQAAADSNGREKLARLPGLGNREKKREEEKKKRQLGQRIELGSAELNAQI